MMDQTEERIKELPSELLIQLNLLCNELEDAWASGKQPKLTEYLTRIPHEYRSIWMRELLELDVAHRKRMGQEMTLNQYRDQLPNCSVDFLSDLIDTNVVADETGDFDQLTDSTLQTGSKLLDRYAIIEQLGMGGMGQVFRAHDTRLGRDVAIKVLRTRWLSSDTMRERFERELRHVAAVTHPSIVKVFDVAKHGQIDFAVMEFVRGTTVRHWLKQRHPWQAVARVALDVASGLDAAHSSKLIHRDIKPENIIVADNGHALVLDFGLARPETQREDQNLTSEVEIPGTVPYMSPEQTLGEKMEVSSDMFSFGIVLFEMLTGVNPYKEDSPSATLRNIRYTQQPPLASSFVSDVPPVLDHLVAKLLSPDPKSRPTASETIAKLHQLLHPADTNRASKSDVETEATAACNTSNPTNISKRRVELHGREKEVQALLEMVETNPVVTVSGPGGVGKTSLAKQVAQTMLPQYPGGVWACELAEVTSSANVLEVLAGVLVGSAGAEQNIDEMVMKLAGQPSLLLFDNCEHVIDQVAELVDTLVQRIPNLTVLATSRESLQVASEAVLFLDGLPHGGSDSDAVSLFLARAKAAVGRDLSEDDTTIVEQIVTKLEGLPLAIELAASKLRTISLEELLGALDDQLATLDGGRRRKGRQRRIDQTIAWSFDLLKTEEQEMLLALSVFSAPFSVEAAMAVAGEPHGGKSIFRRLVEQSVVARTSWQGMSRFRLLEPIRQFCQAKLSVEMAKAAYEAHAVYYANRAKELSVGISGENEIKCANTLNDEWPDLREAVAWGRRNQRVEIGVQPMVDLARTLFFPRPIGGLSLVDGGTRRD